MPQHYNKTQSYDLLTNAIDELSSKARRVGLAAKR
jgi:hypothetical protein